MGAGWVPGGSLHSALPLTNSVQGGHVTFARDSHVTLAQPIKYLLPSDAEAWLRDTRSGKDLGFTDEIHEQNLLPRSSRAIWCPRAPAQFFSSHFTLGSNPISFLKHD